MVQMRSIRSKNLYVIYLGKYEPYWIGDDSIRILENGVESHERIRGQPDPQGDRGRKEFQYIPP